MKDEEKSKEQLLKEIAELRQQIAEFRVLERQIFHSQKMEAIGNLAAGIAHDFNNLLTGILGNLEFAKMEISPDHPAIFSLEIMEEAGQRARELCRQLQQFGRPAKTEEEIISLNQMVEESISFLRAVIPTTIEIEIALSHDPCLIKANPSIISLLITNLSVNARDAMPEGGKLRFETELVTVNESYCKSYVEASPGEFCVLKVSDTGAGMTSEIEVRIFEPFFTTKERGMGTGLGLSMVYSGVRQMGGWIKVYSEPGRGTEFKIYIPKTGEEVQKAKRETVEIIGGNETILLADDEEMILNLGKRILERYGYKVLTAMDTEKAVSIFREKEKDLSLVILDLTMPGGGGLRAMKEIHNISQNFPVILSSGYSADYVGDEGKQKAMSWLSKPFSPIHMANLVRKVLDGKDKI